MIIERYKVLLYDDLDDVLKYRRLGMDEVPK